VTVWRHRCQDRMAHAELGPADSSRPSEQRVRSCFSRISTARTLSCWRRPGMAGDFGPPRFSRGHTDASELDGAFLFSAAVGHWRLGSMRWPWPWSLLNQASGQYRSSSMAVPASRSPASCTWHAKGSATECDRVTGRRVGRPGVIVPSSSPGRVEGREVGTACPVAPGGRELLATVAKPSSSSDEVPHQGLAVERVGGPSEGSTEAGRVTAGVLAWSLVYTAANRRAGPARPGRPGGRVRHWRTGGHRVAPGDPSIQSTRVRGAAQRLRRKPFNQRDWSAQAAA